MIYGAAAAKVMRQTWGSKDSLAKDNAQLRPDTHLPSNCNKWMWYVKRGEKRNKEMGVKEKRKRKKPPKNKDIPVYTHWLLLH